ncbi:lipid-A-disaccharide synthase [Candidatus Saganbacteria bacterium]|nr:lipid-A-disaccharide synthase [Candidatus Saganbacteria bacterium]
MKILFSAGEVSGDLHAAFLLKELRKLLPEAHFFGMGGEKLSAAGFDVKLDITALGSIGLFEALPRIFSLNSALSHMKALLLSERPDLLILIDSQGFNMPLASYAGSLGIKTCYYIPPQEWLWGTARGTKKVAESLDLILAIFEKEYFSYKKAGGRVKYFGHPLLDIVKPSLSRSEARKRFTGDFSGPVVALCPGSRTQELAVLLPLFIRSAYLIKRAFPEVRFLMPAASSWAKNIIGRSVKSSSLPINIIEGLNYDVLNCSDLVIAASGTINLESSILGIPNIMVYKLSWLSYFIGKYILRIDKKMPYFSMPNILINEKLVPELIMGAASPENISAAALPFLSDPTIRKKTINGFLRVKTLLGSPGAISRCASAIVDSFSLK